MEFVEGETLEHFIRRLGRGRSEVGAGNYNAGGGRVGCGARTEGKTQMKAIGYIRWSSDDQTSGDSLERQTANVQAYCQRAGLELVETLVDEGLSGFKGEHLSRGKLGALLVGRIDSGLCSGMALVVEDMDRLSRQGIVPAGSLIERIGKGNVTIHIAKDGQIIRPGSNNNLDTSIRNVVNAYNAED
jgi:DNA invertase Pin-like site-specific DNA recombinase